MQLLSSYRLSLEVRGLRPETIKGYIYWTQRFADFAGPAEDTTRHTVLDFLASERQRGLAMGSISVAHRSLRPFTHWLFEEGITQVDAMAGLRTPPPDNKTFSSLTMEEVTKLLADAHNLRDEALLRFLLDTGVRVSECVSLKVETLYLQDRTALVTGKTGPRMVAYGGRTTLTLDRLLRREGIAEGPVWRGKRGPMGRSGIQQAVHRLTEDALGHGIYPHRLRHTWAHRAMEQGIPDRVVMALGGWSSSDMLRRYAKGNEFERAKAQYRSFLD